MSAAKNKGVKLAIEYVDKHGDPVRRVSLIGATATDVEVAEIFTSLVAAFNVAREEMS